MSTDLTEGLLDSESRLRQHSVASQDSMSAVAEYIQDDATTLKRLELDDDRMDSPETPISRHLSQREAADPSEEGFVWADMVHIAGPQITEERLKSYWTSMGVTSALVGSMAFSGIYTGPVEHFGADQTPRVVVELYAMSMGFSLLTSLTAVIISTLLHSQMNNLPRLEDTKWFILKYEKYHMAPTILFKAAIGSLGFALVMGCWPLYGLRVTAFVVTVAILLTGAVMSVCSPTGIQVRVLIRTSPLGIREDDPCYKKAIVESDFKCPRAATCFQDD